MVHEESTENLTEDNDVDKITQEQIRQMNLTTTNLKGSLR